PLSRLVLLSAIILALAVTVAVYLRLFRSSAFDDYMQGKVLVRRENQGDIESAIKVLKQAVSKDPNLAAAWAELAYAYNLKAFYYAPAEQKKQLTEDAKVAVEHALTLNPELAEGHFARGFIYWTHDEGFPHEQVIKSYQHAIELNPKLDEAHHQL